MGDALTAVLLDAAGAVEQLAECQLYVVSRSPDDEDLIFVTDVWSDPAAHAASLDNADTRALIARAMPLLAQPPESTVLRPMGGKGVVASGG